MCVAGQLIVAPTASEATGSAGVQAPSTALASVTVALVTAVVPLFVTVIV